MLSRSSSFLSIASAALLTSSALAVGTFAETAADRTLVIRNATIIDTTGKPPIEEVLKAIEPDESYFWATHQGAELDLLLFKDGRRLGIEVKRADAPAVTPSMRIALHDLRLEHLTVVYPGATRYALTDRITVSPVTDVTTGAIARLFPPRKRVGDRQR